MMPHQRGGVKADRLSPILQPPAHIHVVSGGAIYRIEAADRFQIGFPDREVASRDVLGKFVGDQYVDRAAGGVGDTFRDRPISWRRQIRPADRGMSRRQERVGQIVQPLQVRTASSSI